MNTVATCRVVSDPCASCRCRFWDVFVIKFGVKRGMATGLCADVVHEKSNTNKRRPHLNSSLGTVKNRSAYSPLQLMPFPKELQPPRSSDTRAPLRLGLYSAISEQLSPHSDYRMRRRTVIGMEPSGRAATFQESSSPFI